MLSEELIKNYNIALSQKYNAVCFDIDGTLTDDNSTKINTHVLPYLADIIKRNVPIVFITGRGESGLKELLSDILNELKNNYNITQKQLLKMYALTNDGARIFLTSPNSKTIFDVDQYITPMSILKKLENLNQKIMIAIKKFLLNKYCKIVYSKDSKTNDIINIRILFLTNDEKINNDILKTINILLKEANDKNLNLTIGVHNGQKVVQIGTAVKNIAIQVAERIIGIPQNSMLRVGDCGDETGNDYSMLNCSQGFSVGTTTKDNDKCFPVIEDGQIKKGVSATISLLKQVKLLPTICLEHSTLEEYTKEYAKIEKKINQEKIEKTLQFNNLINDKFLMNEGINGLFDSSSGSIKIPMYEWYSITDDNPLKQLWMQKNNLNLNYSMYDNNNILLRGPLTYYYFLSNRIHNTNTREDITTRQMVYNWLKNNFDFLSKCLIQINKINDLNELNNLKMILGIFDNIRNYLLILLNQQILANNNDENILVNLEALPKQYLLYRLYIVLLKTENLMKEVVFNKNFVLKLSDINDLIQSSLNISEEFRVSFNRQPEKENYSKEFRAYREIDNFGENFSTCYLTLQNNGSLYNKGVCGLCYGGIELPIIMRLLDDNLKDVTILKFNKNVTGYSKKQSIELRFFNIFQNGGIKSIGIDKQKEYILLDDNLLTGKTMQLALTTFYDIGIKVDKIMVVRYPGVNRISQMFLPNHGAIDYRLFFDFIQGLYFPSPYSWRDPHSQNLYEDSLGVFDLNREKILKCLVKNGNYSNKSEVIYLKRS